jgi:hypothetical protein
MIDQCDGNHDLIFLLSNGYRGMYGDAYRCVRGSIKSFVDAHGDRITPNYMDSMTKRIVSGLGTAVHNRTQERRPYKQFGGYFLDEHIEDYYSIMQNGG